MKLFLLKGAVYKEAVICYIIKYYCGGESSSSMSSAGTSNKSKDKIRNTHRREIVGTDIRELSPKANFDL
jgi:hypothetical protein